MSLLVDCAIQIKEELERDDIVIGVEEADILSTKHEEIVDELEDTAIENETSEFRTVDSLLKQQVHVAIQDYTQNN